MSGRAPAGVRLRVDPARCDGVGQCARLAPDLVTLDRWGYPRVAERPLTEAERRAAGRAARACPLAALWFQPAG